MVSLWPGAALAAAVLAVLAVLGYVELVRYDAKLAQCYATLATHVAFTGRSICTSDAQRDEFERAQLVSCTGAEFYVRSAHPRICALKAWFADSWLGEVWRVIGERLLAVWLNATGSIALFVVLPVIALFGYWIKMDQRGKTERAALRSEEVGAIVGEMSKMRQHYQRAGALPPPPAGGARLSPLVEDVSEDASGDEPPARPGGARKTDSALY